MKVSTDADAQQVIARLQVLLDRGRPREALEFVQSCEDGEPFLVLQVQAFAHTSAGEALGDRAVLERAVTLWSQLDPDKHSLVGYNVANAELAIWTISERVNGFVKALESDRTHLHRARVMFRRAAEDTGLDMPTRLMAGTNLGNSYDIVGRDVDALVAYDAALELDSTFGMASGNRGVALLGIAPFMSDHLPEVLGQAAAALDAALADANGVLENGGASALECFRRERARIEGDRPAAPSAAAKWSDHHLAWCARHGLFLHVSPECAREDAEHTDPIFFRGLTLGLDDAAQQRGNDLVDAFNAIKQDYVSARYQLWLASGNESPIREHASAVSNGVHQLDSLMYARWGVRTGLAAQSFAAATNLLDKLASFVHLYFETSRVKNVYFRTLWHPPRRRNQPDVMDEEIARVFSTGRANRGLMALCDLSCDLEQDTPLNRLVERRHAVTHRFLVVHHMLLDSDRGDSDWVERVDWHELVDGATSLLRTARAGLIYLARTIDIAEFGKGRGEDGRPLPVLPLPPAPTEHPEFD
jgi:HEPN superfamily protein